MLRISRNQFQLFFAFLICLCGFNCVIIATPPIDKDSISQVFYKGNPTPETIIKMIRVYDSATYYHPDSLNKFLSIGYEKIKPLSQPTFEQREYQILECLNTNQLDTASCFKIFLELIPTIKEEDPEYWAKYKFRAAKKLLDHWNVNRALGQFEELENELSKDTLGNVSILVRIYQNQALGYEWQHKYLKAIERAEAAKSLANKHGSIKEKYRANNAMISLYGNLSLPNHSFGTEADRARYKELIKPLLEDSYNYAKEIDHYGIKGTAAYNLGVYYSEEKDFAKSNRYLHESLAHNKISNYTPGELASKEILLDNFDEQGITDSVNYYFSELERLTTENTAPRFRHKTATIGAIIFRESDPKLSLAYAREALDIAEEFDEERKLMSSHRNLYEALLVNKKYAEAITVYQQYIDLKDAISDAEKVKELEALRTKYEAAEKEAKILELSEDKLKQKTKFQRSIGVVGFLLFGVSLGFVTNFYRSKTQILTEKKQALEMEQRLLRSQMNPHFTFNALGSIQHFLMSSGQAEKGAYYLAKFSKLMRQILDQSRKSLINLEEEFETLENYLSLQKLRYENKFEFTIKIENITPREEIMIPPMMVQPLLENAIEHGRVHTLIDGKIDLSIIENSTRLIIEVKDNGIGRETAQRLRKDRNEESVATDIIHSRLRSLRAKYKLQDLHLNYKDLDKGTLATIVLPKVII